MRKILEKLKLIKLQENNEGVIAIISAILLPVFLLILGGQISYGAAEVVSLRIHNAVGAAIVAINKAPSNSNQSTLENLGRNAFIVNIPLNGQKKHVLLGQDINSNNLTVKMDATGKVTIIVDQKIKKLM